MIPRIYTTPKFKNAAILRFAFILLCCAVSVMAWSQTIPPATTNACIGPQGKLKWDYWNDVERYDLQHLYSHAYYPQAPSGSIYVTNAASPYRFNDYVAGVLKGFFTVPTSGDYQFNVTADDRAIFYLSTNDDPVNMDTVIVVGGATGRTEYYKYPEQTSDMVTLQENTYYYFELHEKEVTGADHAYLYWHTPTMADSAWQIIPVNHVYEMLCEDLCPPAGTPCDDGNPNSVNDKEDGSCNCFGREESALGCVGDQGEIQVMTWFDVPGSGLENLYNLPTYPLIPDSVEFLGKYGHFGQYNAISSGDSIGKLVKAFLTVPQTGEYSFNITADDRARLLLSTDEEVFNAQEIAYTVNSNGIFEHTEHEEQTSNPITLVAGQYYYIELHFKENTNTSRFHVYWKTPFARDNEWKVIPLRYLYNYECEMACLPDGTACDDKDASTYNDMITDCVCAGTPCPGGDCTELETYTPNEACSYTDEHSNTQNNSWLSCTPSENPNPQRGVSHWISYDFGQVYQINSAMLWNYNVVGNTGAGIRDFVLDYSIDGETWIELGSFQMPEASGANDYAGVVGAALNGIGAQYVLITILSTWDNGACAGLSEISFEAQECPEKGTPCDDGDANTSDDMYDAYCQCRGLGIAANECTVDSLDIPHNPALSQTYSAKMYIESSKVVEAGSNVNFVAGVEIDLKPAFEVALGSNFLATIIPCTGTPVSSRMSDNATQILGNPDEIVFFVHKDPNTNLIYLKFHKKGMQDLLLRVTDYMGNEVVVLNQENLKGTFEQKFDFGHLSNGIYNISIQADGQLYEERVVLNGND